jgi:hypothetical protein
MSFSIHSMAIDTFVPMLRTLSTLLDKGVAHVEAKGGEPDTLAEARLAPDMFPLSKQVQIACDFAKNCIARLAAHDPPRFEDNEKTITELKARIAKTLTYLESATPVSFSGAEDRQITVPLPGDMILDMKGSGYLRDWALPHFYFHVVTAYDILRHAGVQIGKLDLMAHAGYGIRKKEAASA